MAIPAGLLVHHFVLDGNISVIIGVAMELCTDIYAPYRTNSYNFVCVCQDTTVWLLRDVCHLPGQDTITPAISSNVPEWATLTLPCTKWTKFHFVWPRSSIDTNAYLHNSTPAACRRLETLHKKRQYYQFCFPDGHVIDCTCAASICLVHPMTATAVFSVVFFHFQVSLWSKIWLHNTTAIE